MNKRLLAGVAAAGIIGGGVYGFAATLTLSSDTVSANSASVGSCDSDGVTVDYTVEWAVGGYQLDKVTVSGIAATCDTDAIKVTTLEGSTPSEQTGTVNEAATAGEETFDFSADTVSAKDLSNVHVVIAG